MSGTACPGLDDQADMRQPNQIEDNLGHRFAVKVRHDDHRAPGVIVQGCNQLPRGPGHHTKLLRHGPHGPMKTPSRVRNDGMDSSLRRVPSLNPVMDEPGQ
jgi:hypothetical protein